MAMKNKISLALVLTALTYCANVFAVGLGDTVTDFETAHNHGYRQVFNELNLVNVGYSRENCLQYSGNDNFGSPPRIGSMHITVPKQYRDDAIFYDWAATLMPKDAQPVRAFLGKQDKIFPELREVYIFKSETLAKLKGYPTKGGIFSLSIHSEIDNQHRIALMFLTDHDMTEEAKDMKMMLVKPPKK